MDKFMRVLQFLRVTDESNNLSITNIAVVAFAIKLMVSPIDPVVAIGFVMSLLQYSHKRHITLVKDNKDKDMEAKVQRMEDKVEAKMDELSTLVNTNIAKNEQLMERHEEDINNIKLATHMKSSINL